MRTASEPSPGLELAGSVRLVEKLGEGGMGSVWTAQHLALNTLVAVKFLASHMAQDAAAAARFQREAMAAARIKSPHVVQIFDHGVSHFGPYIVMERLEGETLASFVHRHGRLTPAYAVKIVAQLCRALSKAHAQGVVHRDIKPDNVFLLDPEHDAFVKVLDFGIAKSLRDELSVTSTGAMMGTPHYMSPEQMLSTKHVDLRADLWAVTVLAYHAITGEVPFDGETFGAVAIAVAQAEFAPIFPKYGVGSPELDAWFARGLARDLNARFTSAEELAETFARAVGSGFADVSSTGSGQRVAQATTFNTSPGQPAPTFAGVSSTLPRRGQGGLYVAVGAAALVGALVLALVLLKAPSPPAPAIAGTGASIAAPPSQASAPAPSSLANEPKAESAPSISPKASAAPSASVDAVPSRPLSGVRPRPKAGPVVTPPTSSPARPDRGF